MARIVVIDDEVRLLRTIRRILETAGHEVLAGTRWDEVEQHLKPRNFDVLLSDILLPGISGVEILQMVAKRGCDGPVILMTGEPNVESASEAVRLGAYDYLAKPVSKSQLLDAVTRATRHVDLIREKVRAEESERNLLENLAQIGENAAMLAHEIKSPVSSVNLALRAVADQLGADQRQVVEELLSKMQRLETTLLRMLQFVKPLQGKLEAISVRDLFEGLERHLDADLAAVPLEYEVVPEGLQFGGDSQLMDQLLGNLVRNAAKALLEADDGSSREPRVLLRAVREDSGVRLSVEDSGPGIPRESWDEVFRPFFSKSGGGTGLGLAICKKIADAHGAEIRVGESALGGASFVIKLPANQAHQSGSAS
ncbi:MAG: hypothetical protein CSA62_04005 [Planctomycetota bacterium]|nr:MAG: hypothetical protein CSA62_04005 [Planctomycetota bacterium]